jgi:hypothetical protein
MLRLSPHISTITVAVPDPLDAALVERMKAVGAQSKEERQRSEVLRKLRMKLLASHM